jgi:hypothetical protein
MKYKIKSYEVYTDFATVGQLYSQGSQVPTGLQVNGLEVHFIVSVTITEPIMPPVKALGVTDVTDLTVPRKDVTKEFRAVWQTSERTDGLMAYSGYEMEPGVSFGCDADETPELREFAGPFYDAKIVGELEKRAEAACREYLQENGVLR